MFDGDVHFALRIGVVCFCHDQGRPGLHQLRRQQPHATGAHLPSLHAGGVANRQLAIYDKRLEVMQKGQAGLAHHLERRPRPTEPPAWICLTDWQAKSGGSRYAWRPSNDTIAGKCEAGKICAIWLATPMPSSATRSATLPHQ